MTRTVIGFAGSTVAVESEGATAERVTALLLRRLARVPDAPGQPTVSLRMYAPSDAGTLAVDGGTPRELQDPGALAEHAQAELAYRVITACRSGLMVHAGAVSMDGRAVLLPAQSGHGKSTLTAWLLARGWMHHTDELAHLPLGGGPLEGWRRPIELKAGGRAILEPLIAQPRSESSWLDTGAGGCMLDPELLGAGRSAAMGSVSAMVFPRYAGPSAPLALQRLSQAQASFALMQCVLNAPNLPGHGLHAAAAWARRVPAHALTYGSFEGVDDALAGCLAQRAPA